MFLRASDYPAIFRWEEVFNIRFIFDFVFIDVGPNLGAINRAALIAADYVVVPLGADLFSIQGLKNLGPSLINWRKEWQKRLGELPESLSQVPMPKGKMEPIGYVLLQHGSRESRPVKAYDNWANQIPNVYNDYIINDKSPNIVNKSMENDPNTLGMLKYYQSLNGSEEPSTHLN